MKRNLVFWVLLILLIGAFTLSSCQILNVTNTPSDQDHNTAQPGSNTENAAGTKPITDFSDYAFVVPSDMDEDALLSVYHLQSEMYSLFGIQLPVLFDHSSISSEKKEILIGNTNREKSSDVLLQAQDEDVFVIAVKDETFVINAQNEEWLPQAMAYFFSLLEDDDWFFVPGLFLMKSAKTDDTEETSTSAELTDKDIQNLIEKAQAKKEHTITLTGNYTVYHTIVLPSDFTLILADCSLTMADGVMAQMFTNGGYTFHGQNTLANRDRNIQIIGIGRAILDGGNYNGLSEKTERKNGLPDVSQNNMLLFCNVEGFTVRGLQIRNQRYWALNFLFCSDGCISDIDFCSDDRYVDKNGNLVHGLQRSNYDATYVKNADGIDLRVGCHDILIENITGFTEDDSIALTLLDDLMETEDYNVVDAARDVYNVAIRNIRMESFCSIVRLLNQANDAKLYNVLIDGVFDTSLGSQHMDVGLYGVRVGDTHTYGSAVMTNDSVYNVSIHNVYSRGSAAVYLAGNMTYPDMQNINVFDSGAGLLMDKRTLR